MTATLRERNLHDPAVVSPPRASPAMLDLPGPSRRIVVEPLVLPDTPDPADLPLPGAPGPEPGDAPAPEPGPEPDRAPAPEPTPDPAPAEPAPAADPGADPEPALP